MAYAVQFRRGTTAQHASFTGEAGEVTVNTDTNELVVHDGTTVGGHVIGTSNGSGGDANIRVEGVDGESYIEFANTSPSSGSTSLSWGIGLNDNLNLYFGYGPNYTLNKTNGIAGTQSAFLIDTTGNVGINQNNPNEKLHVVGNILASGNVTAYSDISLKDNITSIPDALDKVLQLRGVTYNRNDIEDNPRHAGVIAQEVEAVLPEVITESQDGIKSVAYGNMVGLLVEAIKELKAEIEELKGK